MAAEAPQNHDSEQLTNEVVGALTIAAYQPDTDSMGAFARAVRGLHWSNRMLTHTVRTYATKLQGFATLAPPDICADVKAWAAGGFRRCPRAPFRSTMASTPMTSKPKKSPCELFSSL